MSTAATSSDRLTRLLDESLTFRMAEHVQSVRYESGSRWALGVYLTPLLCGYEQWNRLHQPSGKPTSDKGRTIFSS